MAVLGDEVDSSAGARGERSAGSSTKAPHPGVEGTGGCPFGPAFAAGCGHDDWAIWLHCCLWSALVCFGRF